MATKIIDKNGKTLSTVPPIVGLKPVGSMVLIERLTAQETMSSIIQIDDETKTDTPQAYVLDVGPTFNPEVHGFNKGDRVIVVGVGNPAPGYDNHKRQRVFTEPHTIKGVLKEAK